MLVATPELSLDRQEAQFIFDVQQAALHAYVHEGGPAFRTEQGYSPTYRGLARNFVWRMAVCDRISRHMVQELAEERGWAEFELPDPYAWPAHTQNGSLPEVDAQSFAAVAREARDGWPRGFGPTGEYILCLRHEYPAFLFRGELIIADATWQQMFALQERLTGLRTPIPRDAPLVLMGTPEEVVVQAHSFGITDEGILNLWRRRSPDMPLSGPGSPIPPYDYEPPLHVSISHLLNF